MNVLAPVGHLWYASLVNVFRENVLNKARRATESERLEQALRLMASGIELKRVALRNRYRDETEAQIDSRLRQWLLREDVQ